jgi:hypothetical protein
MGVLAFSAPTLGISYYLSMPRKSNLLDKRFGHVTVISEYPNDGEWVQWLCRCDCGKEVVRRAQNLIRGCGLSCGCSHGNRKYDPVKSSAMYIFKANYADTDMTIDQFMEISKRNCYYCDCPPTNSYASKSGAIFIYNGLDRVDSSLPHLLSNCVPCCNLCNKMKWDMSMEEFISRMKKVINHLSRRDSK